MTRFLARWCFVLASVALAASACGSVPPAEPDAAVDAAPPTPTECEPNTSVCANDVVTHCGPTGEVEGDPERCELGCFADGTRCARLDPSNGLAAALDDTETAPAVVLTNGAIVDTDSGNVVNGNGTLVSIPSVVVNSDRMRVYKVASIEFGDTRVQGQKQFAVVSSGPIVVRGGISANGRASARGPGNAGCSVSEGAGGAITQTSGRVPGAGGGGFAGTGGAGGANNGNGGASGRSVSNASLEPLRAGCDGGSVTFSNGSQARGGGGGGAMQLVSNTSISVSAQGDRFGFINVGGGAGGVRGGGGGSGGGLLLEAPQVAVTGVSSGGYAALAANGGGGAGGCDHAGEDGRPDGARAFPGFCATNSTTSGGDGGATSNLNGGSGQTYAGSATTSQAGGGGGGAGVIRINTANGAFSATGGAVVSGSSSVGTVRRR